jgi:hypothetical protein
VVGARPATAEKAVTMVIAYAIERGGRREKRERERGGGGGGGSSHRFKFLTSHANQTGAT